MKHNKSLAFQLLIGMIGAFALSACGASPVGAKGAAPSAGGEGAAALSRGHWLSSKMLEEELDIKANPMCGVASSDFKPYILDIISRFNDTVDENARAGGEPLLPAGHPDSADGVSVRVCSDDLVAAYAFTRTVVVHEGLLAMLRQAAQAQALFGAGSEKSQAMLNRIAEGSESGDLRGALTADEKNYLETDATASLRASELFSSAAAFVIFHELAHTQPGRNAYYTDGDGAQSPLNPYREFEADSFAVEAMRSAGFSMEGADLVFAVLERINPEGSIGHPSSWERAKTVRMAENGEPFAYSFR